MPVLWSSTTQLHDCLTLLCKVCQKQRSHIEKFVFPTFFSHRLRPSRMVQFVCACFIEVNMISLTQSIRIREGILKTPAKGKPYAFHMIVSRIRKKVSRLSHRSLRDMDRHKYGRYTEAEEHNRSASADKSCVELLEEPGFAAMPDNRREWGVVLQKVFFGDAPECPKYSSV